MRQPDDIESRSQLIDPRATPTAALIIGG